MKVSLLVGHGLDLLQTGAKTGMQLFGDIDIHFNQALAHIIQSFNDVKLMEKKGNEEGGRLIDWLRKSDNYEKKSNS